MAVGTRGMMFTAAGLGMLSVVMLSTATLSSCDDKAKAGGDKTKAQAPAAKDDKGAAGAAADTKPAVQYEEVTINGKKFKLELALDVSTRFKGLSGRTEIPADGGMLFVFPRPTTSAFVMRDCPVDIDIIYLDATGRVVNTYKMTAEKPRGEGETVNDPATGVNQKYEDRLKKYPSEYDTQYVIELKGGTLDGLNLKKRDKVALDLMKLKKMAK
jgi:uncharacterized membrane protein (UPF0127 family)